MATSSKNSVIALTANPSSQGSAIAVIRIHGPLVPQFLAVHFSKSPIPGKCLHAQLRDQSEIIDDPILLLSQDSQWADISLHGGPWILASALALCQREGFTHIPSFPSPGTPGEGEGGGPLPHESFAEASDDFQREMLTHLPQALTRQSLRLLLNQPTLWHEALKNKSLDPTLILQDQTLWRLLHPPQIAIVGEPNVGKSTLANLLFAAPRSITADIPGTTRDYVAELADIAGLPATIIDTPGHRQTPDPLERAAIASSQKKIAQSDLLLILLDATHPPQTPLTFPASPQKITIINKIDQPSAWDFQSLNPIPISAKTAQGIEALHAAIHRELGITDLNENRPRWWTDRQKLLLQKLPVATSPLFPSPGTPAFGSEAQARRGEG